MLWMLLLFIILLLCALITLDERKKRKFQKLFERYKLSLRYWPFVGQGLAFLCTNGEEQMKIFIDAAIESYTYGGLLGCWIANRFYLYITNADVAENILKKCSCKDDVTSLIHLLSGYGSIFAPVPIWRPRRKLVAPTFCMKNLTEFVKTFNEQSKIMIKCMKDIGHEPVSISEYLIRYSLDAVCDVADPSSIQTLLTQCLEKHNLMKVLELLIGGSSFIAPVPIWRVRRRMMIPSFNTSNLVRYCEVFSKRSINIVGLLEQQQNKGTFSFWEYMSAYSFSTVCETTMGVKMEAESKVLQAVEELWDFGASTLTQPWKKIFVKMRAPHLRTFYKNKAIVRDCITDIIHQKRKLLEMKYNKKESSEWSPATTFLERQLAACGSQRLSDEELLEECITILVAGFDTTAVAGAFAVLLLSTHPAVQDRLYHEMEEVFGDSDRPVTYEDLPRLKYLEAVIKETIRLYPPAPVIGRTAEKDIDLPSGLTVVKNVGVLINIWGVHRNPAYWGADADHFCPERFLDTTLTHAAAFIPFGYGPRNCIGYRYAMLSLKIWLSTVVRRVRVLPPPGVAAGHLPRAGYNMMLTHADHYQIRIVPRK